MMLLSGCERISAISLAVFTQHQTDGIAILISRFTFMHIVMHRRSVAYELSDWGTFYDSGTL